LSASESLLLRRLRAPRYGLVPGRCCTQRRNGVGQVSQVSDLSHQVGEKPCLGGQLPTLSAGQCPSSSGIQPSRPGEPVLTLGRCCYPGFLSLGTQPGRRTPAQPPLTETLWGSPSRRARCFGVSALSAVGTAGRLSGRGGPLEGLRSRLFRGVAGGCTQRSGLLPVGAAAVRVFCCVQ